MPQKVVCLCGATAVGKTDLIEPLFGPRCQVVAADSMQVYRDLNIGVAKPSGDLLARIPHHLLNILDLSQQFSAGMFVSLANDAIATISSDDDLAVVCGGSALYIKHFIYGMPPAPPADPSIRAEIRDALHRYGAERLHRLLRTVDSVSARRISPRDSYRIARALEVYRLSGRPLSDYRMEQKRREDYEILLIGLYRPPDEMRRRIVARVDAMFREGLIEEIAALADSGRVGVEPGLRAIGYREFFERYRDRLDLLKRREISHSERREIREAIITNTMRYRKRQMTFFRSFRDMAWYRPDDASLRASISLFLDSALGAER